MAISDSIQKVKSFILADKKRSLIVAGILAGVIILTTVIIVWSGSYVLDSSVTDSLLVIPEDASYYLEIKDPQKLQETISSSPFGKSILESSAWQKLLATPEAKKLFNILYYIELKTGMLFDLNDLPTFFTGSVGFARMQDRSMLAVASTDIKSKIGIAIYTALKGDKIPLRKKAAEKVEKKKPAKKEGTSEEEQKIVTRKDYKGIYTDKDISLANLTVSRIELFDGFIYLIMVDNFLFISDKLDTLEKALKAATDPSRSSLKDKPAIQNAFKSLEKDGVALAYMSASHSPVAPLLKGMGENDGIALVAKIPEGKDLTASIFLSAISEQKDMADADWAENLPRETVFSFFSRHINIPELLDSFDSLSDDWKGLKLGSEQFFKAAKIDPDTFFGKKRGLALVMHGMDTIHKNLYPQFSIGYAAEKNESRLLSAIFKGRGVQNKSFQGTSYVTMKNSSGSSYSPSFMSGPKMKVISSRTKFLETIISSQKGNRPILKDLQSFKLLEEFSSVPHQVIINIPEFIKGLRNFFYYGAARSSEYTSKTVDRDVLPLFEPFKKYRTLHIAIGKAGTVNGRMVISEQ